MSRLSLLVTAFALLSASPLAAFEPSSTITYRSPTFTRSGFYRPTSTIANRSPTFVRPTYNYGYYGSYRFAPLRSYYYYSGSSDSSAYYRSVLSSGRGLDASRHLYGSSGYRTYTSP